MSHNTEKVAGDPDQSIPGMIRSSGLDVFRKSTFFDRIFWVVTAILLVAGLWLRWRYLGQHQFFQGDQGRDYVDVWRWMTQGEWPLRGPVRLVGDYGLGPGWFYLLAPALVVSGFHPAAGAGFIGLLNIIGHGLSGVLIRRVTGSTIAGVGIVAFCVFSSENVTRERLLWNPNVLPPFFVLTAYGLTFFREHPVRWLMVLVTLCALLVQVHTSWLVLIPLIIVFMIYQGYGVRNFIRRVNLQRYLIVSGLFLLVILILYLPPVMYELQADESHFAGFFRNSGSDESPAMGSVIVDLPRQFLWVWDHLLRSNFPVFSSATLLITGLVAGVGFLLFDGLILFSSKEDFEGKIRPSLVLPGFCLVSLMLFAFARAWRGEGFETYFLTAIYPAVPILIFWLLGMLLKGSFGSLFLNRFRVAMAFSLVGLLAVSISRQAVSSYHISQGQVWYQYHLGSLRENSEVLVSYFSDEVEFSLITPYPDGFSAHFHTALIWQGFEAENRDYYSSTVIRDEWGEHIVVIVPATFSWAEVHNRLSAQEIPNQYVGKIFLNEITAITIDTNSFGGNVDQVFISLNHDLYRIDVLPE